MVQAEAIAPSRWDGEAELRRMGKVSELKGLFGDTLEAIISGQPVGEKALPSPTMSHLPEFSKAAARFADMMQDASTLAWRDTPTTKAAVLKEPSTPPRASARTAGSLLSSPSSVLVSELAISADVAPAPMADCNGKTAYSFMPEQTAYAPFDPLVELDERLSDESLDDWSCASEIDPELPIFVESLLPP